MSITELNRQSINETAMRAFESIIVFPEKTKVKRGRALNLIDQEGRRISAKLIIEVETSDTKPQLPDIRLSVKEGDREIAARPMALIADKENGQDYILATGRVDTYDHEGIGLASGLMVAGENVLRHLYDINPDMADKDMVAIIKDTTDTPLNHKRRWSGNWAERLDYTEYTERRHYYHKTLRQKKSAK